MKNLTFDKYVWTFLFLLTVSSVLGQGELPGKYVNSDNSGGYLILNEDKSFKFRYRSHAYWDLACGQFDIKGDTVLFTYTSDMFDIACNNERINMTDTSDFFLKTGVDKRYRPIIARLVKNKLLTVKTGDIQESESVDLRTYYYTRERKRHVRQ